MAGADQLTLLLHNQKGHLGHGLGGVGRRPLLHAGKEGNMQMTSQRQQTFICPGAAVVELWVYSLMLKEKKKIDSQPISSPGEPACLLRPQRAPDTQAWAFSRSLGTLVHTVLIPTTLPWSWHL